jgi:DNA-binding transcriptional LysR family regulator
MHHLRDMALFVEVVNTRNFSKAARNLDMPASTLSRRISVLEKEIGLRLLNRTTRRVELTQAGATYFAKCAHLVEEAKIAHEDLSQSVTQARGTLRLSCSPDFATLYLPPILKEFTHLYPEVNVDLDLTVRRVDLVGESFDAALRIGGLQDSALVGRHIANLQLGLFAAPEYLAVAPELELPSDLMSHQCIRMRGRSRDSSWTLHANESRLQDALGDTQEVQIHGRFTANSVAMIRKLALLGAGIGVMDVAMVQSDLRLGSLVRVLPEWAMHPVPLTLLTPSRLMPARVRLFSDFLTNALKPNPL